jgi:hypothetical protein
MLVRALQLQPETDEWTSDECNSGLFLDMHLSETEWQHVRYLVALLYPYFTWTKKLFKTSGITIHKAWVVYVALFEHLDRAEGLLLQKSDAWKVTLADSVVVAHPKLSWYYSNADGPRGQIYNWATVLNPSQRLAVYKTASFNPKLHDEYNDDFLSGYGRMYSQLDQPEERSPSPPVSAARLSFTALAASRVRSKSSRTSCQPQLNEYPRSDLTDDDDPLAFWRSREESFPGLAQMAKDVLAVPIAGVGVEHLFSIARRICSYQRHQLGADTIRKMMIVRHWENAAEEEEDEDMDIADAAGPACEDEFVSSFGDADYQTAKEQKISEDEDEGTTTLEMRKTEFALFSVTKIVLLNVLGTI